MGNVKVGLIVAPNMPERLTTRYLKNIQNRVKEAIIGVNFEFEIESNMVVGSAEHVNQYMDYTYERKQKKEWDYSISVTDLPSFSNNKTVLSDISFQNKTAMISLPALGIYRLKHKLCSALVDILYYLYMESETEITNNPPFQKLSSTQVKGVTPSEDANTRTDQRFIYNSTLVGSMKTITGMTFANEPWKAVTSFKKIIALGTATGTYISIFSTPWQLSVAYDWPRFILLMLLSLIGIVGWLIYAHNFWEKPSTKNQKKYRYLYNLTTLLTMIYLTFLSYIILFFLLLTSIVLFVPDNLFESWGHASESHSISNYLRLSWFIASAGLLAGALGSVMEGETKMKKITYTTRQMDRSQEIQRQLEKEEAEDDETREEKHEGQTQTHKE